ncbi:MAG: hypothetical protein KC766_17520 [Myxococcales bacterium]|nr:hypothetical protein [Myxococcales bacterium]
MKPGKSQSISLYVALALTLVAIVFAILMRPEAGTPPDFVRFLGRFHTLAVHLPIGIITLVAIAELASFSKRVQPRVDPAIGFALPIVAVTAVTAFVLGLMLARGGGYPSKLIFWHRALTLTSIALLPVCAGLWAGPVQRGGRGRWVYRGALFSAVGLMSIGAHFGGSMTKGEGYLVQFAPKFARGLLGVKEPEPIAVTNLQPVAEPLVWQHSVQPLLQKHCVECHGPKEAKGGLRLDTLEAALEGGDEGNTIVPGNAAKSALVNRMKLPMGSDERMPPDDKAGLSEAEIALVGWWIDRGATDQLKVREGITPAPVSDLLEKTLSQVASAASAAAGDTPKAGAADAGSLEASKAGADDDLDDDDDDDDDDSEFGPEPNYGSGADDDDDGGDTTPVSLTHRSGPVWSSLISPLLENRCGDCHGPKRQKGKFRVDSLAAIRSGGKGGAGVVPGNPNKGTLLARIHSTKKSEHMPPYSKPQLSASEVELIAWWIKQGADDKSNTSALPSSLAAKYGPQAAKPTVVAGDDDDTDDAGDDTPPTDGGAPIGDAGVATLPDAGPVVAPAADTIALYTDVVKPMLEKRCGACHSGESAMGVRIDDLPGMLEGGDVIPGDPEASPILARQLVPLEELNHMPPKSEPQPETWEIQVLRLWIQDGAKPDARVALADLPPEAIPQGKGGGAKEEPRGAAGSGGEGKAGVQTPSTAGGCAACTISADQASPLRRLAALSVFIGLGALWLRRRRR